MIHIRAVSPTDVTPRLLESLGANGGVVNLVVLEGVARNPDGDSLQFDVIAAEANRVLDELRDLGLARRGSIVIEDVAASISELAARAERHEPRKASSSPIWEEAEARIQSRGVYPVSWFLLMIIAGLIGAVGILTNSQILIVGAMVVGPEYGAMINVAFGIDTADAHVVRLGLRALFFGFLFAIVATLLFGLVIRAFDLEPRAVRTRHPPCVGTHQLAERVLRCRCRLGGCRRCRIADRGEGERLDRRVHLGHNDPRGRGLGFGDLLR